METRIDPKDIKKAPAKELQITCLTTEHHALSLSTIAPVITFSPAPIFCFREGKLYQLYTNVSSPRQQPREWRAVPMATEDLMKQYECDTFKD